MQKYAKKMEAKESVCFAKYRVTFSEVNQAEAYEDVAKVEESIH